MDSEEVKGLFSGLVEFEMLVRHPSGVKRLEEESELEILFGSPDI